MPSVNVNGTSLHYRFDGPVRGPVLMFSNSLSSSLTMWDGQVRAVTDAGFRVLRYDHRGHGRSSVPVGPYSMAQLCGDAKGLMDALDIEQVHFCGLSMGGMVGQMLGAFHGNRLKSLVLCSTASHMPPPDMWEDRMGLVRERGMAAVVDATIDRWFTPSGQERLPGEIHKVRGMILDTDPEGFCGCCAAIRDMDLRDSIREIRARTLVVVGRHDPATPVSAAEFIHRRISSSRLLIISDAAHLVNVEQRDRFNRILSDFLEASPTPPIQPI